MVNVKLPKTVKLKTYVATTLVLAVLLLASVGYVLTSNGTTVTITPQSYIETASYVIEKIGSTVYAKNGSTGEPEFSGTNAATVIQTVFNTVKTYGRIIVKGDISLDSTLVFDYDTNGVYALDFEFDTLRINHNGNGLEIKANVRNVNIRGNNLIAKNDYEGKAVVIEDADANNVELNYLYHLGTVQTGSVGIYIKDNNSETEANHVNVNNIYGFDTALLIEGNSNKVSSNLVIINKIRATNTAVKLHGNGGSIRYNKILVNDAATEATAVYLHAQSSSIYANTLDFGVVRSENGYALQLLGVSPYWINSNHITIGWVLAFSSQCVRIVNPSGGNNFITVVTDVADKVGIYNENTNNEFIVGACLSDITTGKAIENSGKLTCIGCQFDLTKVTNTGTIAYVGHWDGVLGRPCATENSGTATVSNGDYFTHGLAGKPTIVTLTCMNATYDGVPVVVNCNYANTNSTHVCVSMYWTNGTAITADLLVSYYVEYKP